MPNRGFLAMWIIVVVAVVVALVILAYGFFNLGKNRGFSDLDYWPKEFEDSQVKDLKALSGSDELNVIEGELNSTNVDNLDAGLNEEVGPLGL